MWDFGGFIPVSGAAKQCARIWQRLQDFAWTLSEFFDRGVTDGDAIVICQVVPPGHYSTES